MEELKPESKIESDTLKTKVRSLLLDTLNKYGYEVFSDKVFEKANDLKSKYRDYNEYTAYHTFIGSTIPDYVTQLDFPGDDSIVKYLESLL